MKNIKYVIASFFAVAAFALFGAGFAMADTEQADDTVANDAPDTAEVVNAHTDNDDDNSVRGEDDSSGPNQTGSETQNNDDMNQSASEDNQTMPQGQTGGEDDVAVPAGTPGDNTTSGSETGNNDDETASVDTPLLVIQGQTVSDDDTTASVDNTGTNPDAQSGTVNDDDTITLNRNSNLNTQGTTGNDDDAAVIPEATPTPTPTPAPDLANPDSEGGRVTLGGGSRRNSNSRNTVANNPLAVSPVNPVVQNNTPFIGPRLAISTYAPEAPAVSDDASVNTDQTDSDASLLVVSPEPEATPLPQIVDEDTSNVAAVVETGFFSNLSWWMIVLIVIIVGGLLYFVFRKKDGVN